MPSAAAPPRSATSGPPFVLVIGTLAWLAAIGVGLATLWRYQRTAGATAESRSRWPTDTRLPRPTDRPVLLQFVHPHCPCSRASLSELKELQERLPDRASVFVLFTRPAGLSEGWERSDNWEDAREIPGGTVLVDVDGKEAARFGARTSGQTFIYGADGDLLFSGGITPTRGERGSSAGRDRIVAVLEGRTPDRRDSRVFGCSLGESHQGELQ